MLALVDVILKILLFVWFGSIFSNLLMFLKIALASKIMYLFLMYCMFSLIHCMSQLWSPLYRKFNNCTFTIKDHNFWSSSYWEIVNDIFHHGWFVFFFLATVWIHNLHHILVQEQNFWNVLPRSKIWFLFATKLL